MRNKTQGKLIVLEGLDGSGKKTQLDLLSKRLKKEGYKVVQFDFPQYYQTFFGQLVGRFLKGEFGRLSEVSPYLAALLYAGDRWQSKKKIEKNLQKGKIVVANRYFPSQIFQLAKFSNVLKQQEFWRWIEELEYKIYQIPKPDMVIFLDVPVEIGQKLVLDKGRRRYLGRRKHDIHEANLMYQKKVQGLYRKFALKYPYWQTICCFKDKKLLSKEKIAQKIWQIVSKFIGSYYSLS